MNAGFIYTLEGNEFGLGSPLEELTEDGMLGFLLYCTAVLAALFLFMFYRPREDKPESIIDPRFRINRKSQNEFQFCGMLSKMGISYDGTVCHFEAFRDHFKTFDEVAGACKRAGLEKCNLIIGVDFTASNEWQGRKTFNQNCLHKISGNRIFNPYQKVIWIMGQTLASFDEDNLIPCFGFGDSVTIDENVFSFKDDASLCVGFQEVLYYYNQLVPRLTLSGPTSFAPVIRAAIDIVKEENKYHILVIIADGQVNEEQPTIDAIIEASKYPLSIIVIGVGDGPWAIMEEFDHRLPRRKFDNFRFVDYHRAIHKAKNPDTAFALQALMEIPDQYKTMKYLGYISADNSPDENINKGSKKTINNNDNSSLFPIKSKPLSCFDEEMRNRKGSVKLMQKSGSRSGFNSVTPPRMRTNSMKSLRTNSFSRLKQLITEEEGLRRRSSALARVILRADSAGSSESERSAASQDGSEGFGVGMGGNERDEHGMGGSVWDGGNEQVGEVHAGNGRVVVRPCGNERARGGHGRNSRVGTGQSGNKRARVGQSGSELVPQFPVGELGTALTPGNHVITLSAPKSTSL